MIEKCGRKNLIQEGEYLEIIDADDDLYQTEA